MTSSTKHPKDDSPFIDDLERHSGIGESKGAFATGEAPESIEGENTVEGDVENDTRPSGKVDSDQLGRTNR
jgi:hypothetical protein